MKMSMIARLKDEGISRGNSAQMDHTIDEVISYIRRGEAIYPGEIAGSSTVPLWCLKEHKRFLADYDMIELEGIGVLRN